MSRILMAVALVAGGGFALAAQRAQTMITISLDAGRASVQTLLAPYQRGPWAGVPAKPLRPETAATTSGFRIKAWSEGDRTRVVVFAVDRGAKPEDEKETQIATFTLAIGEMVEVKETERYGAAHIVVSAAAS